jgi:hypothetical protein
MRQCRPPPAGQSGVAHCGVESHYYCHGRTILTDVQSSSFAYNILLYVVEFGWSVGSSRRAIPLLEQLGVLNSDYSLGTLHQEVRVVLIAQQLHRRFMEKFPE